jgi:ribosomal protein S18 acetylase RimI-like enzyme
VKRPVAIRHATPNDAAMLARIGADTFLAAYESQVGAAILRPYVAEAFTPERLAEELADLRGLFLIAQLDGVVAGYARVTTGDPPAGVEGDRPIELSRLYAVPTFIGRGIGAALMGAVLDEAGGLGGDVVWLGVWSLNERAIAFYRRWGFETVGSIAFHLGEAAHEDLIMSRRLRDSIDRLARPARMAVETEGVE